MKRDNALLQSILKTLEDSEFAYLTAGYIRNTISGSDTSKDDAINHHIRLLADRGLIDISNTAGIRLTWDGHDALKPKSGMFG
ncbi:hypothetical protein [Burkholderia anthina]|uniref:hypothetical protein n=1 Tax=Burkholderia anthina TaxID=179879 RepID=UPI000F5A0314|nr:hypothetical protein [Burkholderia anthina]RQV81128.1 hypothetical protein DF160_15635 [Burkholderia anthina]